MARDSMFPDDVDPEEVYRKRARSVTRPRGRVTEPPDPMTTRVVSRRRRTAQAPAGQPIPEGHKTTRRAQRKPAPPKAKAAKPSAAGARARKAGRRARREVRAGAESGIRRAARPVRSGISDATVLVFAALGLVALYLLITTAEGRPGVVEAFLGAPAKALAWLADPGTSIPYSSSYRPE